MRLSPRGYQLHVADDTGMSDLVPNLVRLAPNGTNLVLFLPMANFLEKKKVKFLAIFRHSNGNIPEDQVPIRANWRADRVGETWAQMVTRLGQIM